MRRYLSMIMTAIWVLGILASCSSGYEFVEPENTETGQSIWLPASSSASVSATPVPSKSAEPSVVVNLLYEAEDAELVGLQRYTRTEGGGLSATSGSGYVGLWDSDGCSLTFHIEVPVAGTYALEFLTASYQDESYNTVSVNERTFYEALHTDSEDFGFSTVKAALREGANTVIVTAGWGWIYMDCLIVRSSEGISTDVYRVEKSLVNENASDSTRRLMSYLVDQYGKYTLSGQYASDLGVNSPEVQAIYGLTGKYPAIMGFDLMDYSPSRVKYGAETKQTDYALEWGQMGGIVTLIWHWNAPKDLVNSGDLPWWKGFYTEATTFNLDKALSGDDPEGYELILRDLDAIAAQLKRLDEANIPVLWRPLHEGSGGWFWWGAYGADNYKKLWKLMYERFTDYHHLNNLIWVFNGQDADWYPGDDYVDIIAEDVYTQPRDYESHYNRFEQALSYTDKLKIIGLAETGVIPDPDLMYTDNACWSFFIAWSDLFVVDKRTKKISDEYTEFDHFTAAYNSDRIITLDELPDLKNYPLD